MATQLTKEIYYSPETIERAAREFLAALDLRRSQIESMPTLVRSALLVLDMQEYFLDENSHAYVPSAPAILPGIKKLVEVFHTHQRPVFFTRHLNTPQNARQMKQWWRDLINPDSSLSQISKTLDIRVGTVIEKTQYDAFFETRLQEMLEENSTSQVVICGVMTHLCCETTARSAFMRGFEVFFCIDGTATYNRDYHQATLLNLAHGFATPLLVQDILKAVEKNAA